MDTLKAGAMQNEIEKYDNEERFVVHQTSINSVSKLSHDQNSAIVRKLGRLAREAFGGP